MIRVSRTIINNDRNLKFSLVSLVIKNNLTFGKLLIFTLEKQLLWPTYLVYSREIYINGKVFFSAGHW